ncbi:integrating conjugative element protein, PFL_4710 family [Escherichia coli]|uniref:Integrating conjugative element protein, PFL_4710 family n=1 Tax=Escherichia coli TaxID=562 RepID=A0A376MQ97_ECOLX|nr:integrating conjugative element protein, PFL_4710 family [Escherichia coli]
MQTDDDRAAAVGAQRVADIITRMGESHVYREVKGVKRDGYWPPEAVEEKHRHPQSQMAATDAVSVAFLCRFPGW